MVSLASKFSSRWGLTGSTETLWNGLKTTTDYLATHQSYKHGAAHNWWGNLVMNVNTSLQHRHISVWSARGVTCLHDFYGLIDLLRYVLLLVAALFRVHTTHSPMVISQFGNVLFGNATGNLLWWVVVCTTLAACFVSPQINLWRYWLASHLRERALLESIFFNSYPTSLKL